jgi:2,3-bisphosphoglycerate-dependent phosphoglycerate mutase
VLRRAIKWTSMDRMWLRYSINERHYGAAGPEQGRDRFGDEQVSLAPADTGPWTNRCYESPIRAMPGSSRASTECLKDTVARVLPFWNDTIARASSPASASSSPRMATASDQVPCRLISSASIPIAQPLVYELDADLIRNY